jgi:hypothetical protein
VRRESPHLDPGRFRRARAPRVLLLLAVLLLALRGATAAEEVWTWEGPEEGLTSLSLTVGEALVRLRVPTGEEEAAAPALLIRYESESMVLVAPEPGEYLSPGTRPMLVVEREGGALELVPRGDLPGREARLEIELRLDPRAAVDLEAERLEVEASGPWALPPPQLPEEKPASPRGGRRREASPDPEPAAQRVVPPARASLKIRADRAAVAVQGWPGSLTLDVRDYELSGQGLGGELLSKRGEGEVELGAIGGVVRIRAEEGRFHLQEVLGRAEITVGSGDLSLLAAEQGAQVQLSRGELILREIGRRADLTVEEATLELSTVVGSVGGTLRWVDASVQDVRGGLNLQLEEGSLAARGVQAGLLVRAVDAPLEIEDVGGGVQIDAQGPYPVKVKNAARAVRMNLTDSEAEVLGVARGLSVVQNGGTLEARDIAGEPDIRLSEVDLDYAAKGRLLKGGAFHLNGGRARLRLPRRSTLAVSGDDDRVSGNMNRRLLDELEEEELERGQYIILEVFGADVQVTAGP